MPTLLISKYNGKEFVSVEFTGTPREPRMGTFTRIQITDEQALLSIEILKELWLNSGQGSFKQSEERVEANKIKLAALLDRLSDIIRQTHHDGERENAKAMYLKFAGKAFER